MREILDNRRGQLTFDVKHEGVTYAVSAGWKNVTFRGQIREVFIHVDNRRSSSTLEAVLRDTAILISFCLQYGAPLSAIKAAVTRDDHGGPATAIGAILDVVAGLENENG